MKIFFVAIFCSVGIVAFAHADESNKEQLILNPVVGVSQLVRDILDRDEVKGVPADPEIASFENFKKNQMEEFEAFKRGAPTPDQVAERQRANEKALADRTTKVERRLQESFQWALREGLQNRYQVLIDNHQSDANLHATGTITKRAYGYFLEFKIKDAQDKVIYANSSPCQECNDIQIGIKFKELGSVAVPAAAPVVVADTPPPVSALPVPPATPVENNCYLDDYVQICATKKIATADKTPLLTFTAKNLTSDVLFIAGNANPPFGNSSNSSIADDSGNECSEYMTGVERVWVNSTDENAYNRVQVGKSINIHTEWKCTTKVTGNNLDVRLYLLRLTGGKPISFVATLQDIPWKN